MMSDSIQVWKMFKLFACWCSSLYVVQLQIINYYCVVYVTLCLCKNLQIRKEMKCTYDHRPMAPWLSLFVYLSVSTSLSVCLSACLLVCSSSFFRGMFSHSLVILHNTFLCFCLCFSVLYLFPLSLSLSFFCSLGSVYNYHTF